MLPDVSLLARAAWVLWCAQAHLVHPVHMPMITTKPLIRLWTQLCWDIPNVYFSLLNLPGGIPESDSGWDFLTKSGNPESDSGSPRCSSRQSYLPCPWIQRCHRAVWASGSSLDSHSVLLCRRSPFPATLRRTGAENGAKFKKVNKHYTYSIL